MMPLPQSSTPLECVPTLMRSVLFLMFLQPEISHPLWLICFSSMAAVSSCLPHRLHPTALPLAFRGNCTICFMLKSLP